MARHLIRGNPTKTNTGALTLNKKNSYHEQADTGVTPKRLKEQFKKTKILDLIQKPISCN